MNQQSGSGMSSIKKGNKGKNNEPSITTDFNNCANAQC